VADRALSPSPFLRGSEVGAVPVVRSLSASSLRGQTFRTVEASYRKAGHVRQWSRDCITVSRCGPRAGSANFAAGRALSCHRSKRETSIERVSVRVTKARAVSL